MRTRGAALNLAAAASLLLGWAGAASAQREAGLRLLRQAEALYTAIDTGGLRSPNDLKPIVDYTWRAIHYPLFRHERIRALQLGAKAAYFNDSTFTERADTFLAAMVKLDPYVELDTTVAWTGLVRRLAEVRSRTFFVNAFLAPQYVLSGMGARASFEVTASRPSKFSVTFAPVTQLEAPYRAMDSTTAPTSRATLQLRGAEHDSVILPRNRYHVIIRAVGPGDTVVERRYLARVEANPIVRSTLGADTAGVALIRTDTITPPLRRRNLLVGILAGAVVGFAAAEMRTNRYDRMGMVAGLMFAGAGVAAWRHDPGARVAPNLEHNRRVREGYVTTITIDPEPLWTGP